VIPSTSASSAVPASPAASAAASVAPSAPVASAKPTKPPAAVVPPKPAKVTFKKVGERVSGGLTKVTYRLTWTEPADVATSFLAYGVDRCLRDGKAYDEKPCVVKGMKIPKSSLHLLATVPGSVRTVDLTWDVHEGEGPGPYFAVLLRAANGAGNSIFAIAWSDTVCYLCTY
jgi:hypothetical protein